MQRDPHHRAAAAALVVVAALTGGACSAAGQASGSPSRSAPSSTSPAPSDASAAPPAPAPSAPSASSAALTEDLVGPDCGRYADRVTSRRTAGRDVLDVVRDDPRLTWFASALTGGVVPAVDYSGTLADGEWTVFAPTDEAVDEAVRQELAGDPAVLRFFLDHHLVPARAMSPQQLLDAAAATPSRGVQTLQGWDLTVSTGPASSADPTALRLSEDAVTPVCGNITTADARLYLVPALMHPAGDYSIPGAADGGGGEEG